MNRALGHFKTITTHKIIVMKYCFRVGLYWQGLLHDLSKYSPVEFASGIQYYQWGKRSPNNAEREKRGYSSAWLHHKGRNKHHFEYWIDYTAEHGTQITGMRMPANYVIEMFLDRIAAGKVYKAELYSDKDPLEYYMRGKSNYIMHKDVQKLLEKLLHILCVKGEKETLRYVRHLVKRIKKGESIYDDFHS